MEAMRTLCVVVMMWCEVLTENLGNSLVNCAACQALQPQVDNFMCDVNCKVVTTQNGGANITGLLEQLEQRVNQMEENNTALAAKVQQLEQGPVEMFSALGSSVLQGVAVTAGQTLVFPVEVADKLNSYDNTTGIFTAQNSGMFNVVVVVREHAGQAAHAWLYTKKTGEPEEELCVALSVGGNSESICYRMLLLEAGVQLYVKFLDNGRANMQKCSFHATLLYKV